MGCWSKASAPRCAGPSRARSPGDGTPAATHPAFKPHPIQGWAPDFIPKVLEDAQPSELMDELVPIAGADAVAAAKQLASTQGILTGISGGATFHAALQAAKKAG